MIRLNDIVTIDGLDNATFRVLGIGDPVEIEGYDTNGKLYASFDPCGRVFVKRSLLKPTPLQKETLL